MGVEKIFFQGVPFELIEFHVIFLKSGGRGKRKPMKQKIAFFIDDDPNFLELVPEVIRHPDFEIRTFCASNGYHTIDEIIKIRPDVLFIDFYLPRVNGGQILPILRSVQMLDHLPVYFVSGYSKEGIKTFLGNTEYAGILFKDDSLMDEIRKVLDELSPANSV